MRKGKGFREPRRRGFDDDEPFSRETRGMRPPGRPFGDLPRDTSPVEGPTSEATVKWFNPEKGFGFVSPADGTPDAFLHAKVVQSAGVMDLPPGSTVTWNGRPALPPFTPQQARIERSAIDMKWASRSTRMCFS